MTITQVALLGDTYASAKEFQHSNFVALIDQAEREADQFAKDRNVPGLIRVLEKKDMFEQIHNSFCSFENLDAPLHFLEVERLEHKCSFIQATDSYLTQELLLFEVKASEISFFVLLEYAGRNDFASFCDNYYYLHAPQMTQKSTAALRKKLKEMIDFGRSILVNSFCTKANN